MPARPTSPPALSTEKTAARGLARLAARVFVAWGGIVFLKGLVDAFGGRPEADFYSPAPWGFVSRDQWLRWCGFELAYGLACAAVGWAAWKYAARLPEFVARGKRKEDFI